MLLVLCFSAGIGRTGCFIAISIAIQQLMHEHAVDILAIVANLRLDRSVAARTGASSIFTFYIFTARRCKARYLRWQFRLSVMRALRRNS